MTNLVRGRGGQNVKSCGGKDLALLSLVLKLPLKDMFLRLLILKHNMVPRHIHTYIETYFIFFCFTSNTYTLITHLFLNFELLEHACTHIIFSTRSSIYILAYLILPSRSMKRLNLMHPCIHITLSFSLVDFPLVQ